MKNRLIAIAILIVWSIGVYSQISPISDNKLFVHFEGSHKDADGGANMKIWFVQDKETGTRCYAVRADFHDGVAISCVK